MLIQKATLYLSKDMVPLIQMMNDTAVGSDKKLSEYEEPLQDLLSLLTATTNLMNQDRKIEQLSHNRLLWLQLWTSLDIFVYVSLIKYLFYRL